MTARTPLHDAHLAASARMVDFAGWSMPLNYGSQIAEHQAVRDRAGVFDVSHMARVDLYGPDAEAFLRGLIANDVARTGRPGRALYSCMLNEAGGIVDDLIAYRRERGFRLVVNAGTAAKDLDWMRARVAGRDVAIAPREDLAMIAVQGPEARALALPLLPAALASAAQGLASFDFAEDGDWFVTRTGYTGEDGFEIMLPNGEAPRLWSGLLAAGVAPCGLGARDTLRLEAALNLYGQDMDETVTPLECGLGWTVAWEPEDRAFTGRAALEAQRSAGVPRRRIGLALDSGGVMRMGTRVFFDDGAEGVVTSGSFSPTLGHSIGLALVPTGAGGEVSVELRDRRLPVRIVPLPFVGKRNRFSLIEGHSNEQAAR